MSSTSPASLRRLWEMFSSPHGLGVIWGQLSYPVLSFFILTLVSVNIGEAQYNLFMLLYSAALVAGVFSDFGLRTAVTSEVRRLHGDQLRGYLSQVYGYKLAVSVALGLVFLLYCILIEGLSLGAGLAFSLVAANSYVADPGVQALRGQGRGQWEFLAVGLDRGLLLILLATCYMWATVDLDIAVWLMALCGLLRLGFTLWLVRRLVSPFGLACSPASLRQVVRDKVPYGLSLLLFLLFSRLPVLLAPRLGLGGFSGIVAIVLTIEQTFMMLPTAVFNIFMPKMRSDKGELLEAGKLFPTSMRLSLAGGLAGTLAVVVLAPFLLGMFGQSYLVYVGWLRLAALGIPLACLNQMIRFLAISSQVKKELILVLLAANLFLGVGLLLGVHWFDALGLIIAYLCGEVLLLGLYLGFVRRALK